MPDTARQFTMLGMLVDDEGEPTCREPDACDVCRLVVLPLDQIGRLYRTAPPVYQRRAPLVGRPAARGGAP